MTTEGDPEPPGKENAHKGDMGPNRTAETCPGVTRYELGLRACEVEASERRSRANGKELHIPPFVIHKKA
jgi:hypothetical protein